MVAVMTIRVFLAFAFGNQSYDWLQGQEGLHGTQLSGTMTKESVVGYGH